MFVSADRARTWQPLDAGEPVKGALSLVILPGGELYSCTYFGVFRWDGSRWKKANSGLPAVGVQTLLQTRRGGILAGTEQKGVFRLQAAEEHWYRQTQGLIASEITALTESAGGVVFAGTMRDGIYRSRDGGATWEQTANRDGFINTLVADAAGAVYAGTSGFGGVQRSTDDGESWQRLGLDSTITNNLLVLPGGELLAATFDGLYRWQGDIESWKLLAFPGQVVRELHRDVTGRLYTSIPGRRGRLLFVSQDGGSTWEQLTSEPIYWVTLSSNSLGHLFAGTSYARGVLRSLDHGRTWQPTGLADSTLFIYALAIDRMDRILAATNKALLISADNGQSWTEAGGGMQPWVASSLLITRDGYLYAGTGAHGVFRTRTPFAAKRHFTFVLEQNYPNPFNATTTFRFTLPRSGYVTLRVYNALGQEVAVPWEGDRLVGVNEVRWHAAHLASGVYLYRLAFEAFVETRKLVLIR